MSVKNKLISNTIYLFLDWFVLAIIGFFYWLVASKVLVRAELGIASTSVNFALILSGVSILGVHYALWKLIPEYLVKKQNNKIVSLTKFSLKVVLLSNVIILLMLLLSFQHILPLLKIPLNAFLLSGAILFSYSIAMYFRYVIYGFQKMKKIAITDIIGQTVKMVVSLCLIFLGFKYFGLLIGFLLGNIVVILLRITSIPVKGMTEKIDKKNIMFNYALPGFIGTILALVLINGQYVLLTILKNTDVTGLYTPVMVISSILTVIPNTLNSALLPISSQLSTKSSGKGKQNHLIGMVLRYSLFITLPIGILLAFFSKTAILIFSTAEYLPASQFFPILIFGSVIYGIGSIFLDNIYAIGKTKINRNIIISITLLYLILAFPLIHFLSAFGAALAYSISTAILALVSFLWLKKLLKLRLPWGNIGKLLLSIFLSFGVLYAIMPFAQNLLVKIIFGCLTLLLYLMVLFPLKFYTIDDVKILDFIIDRSPILKKEIAKLRNFLSNRIAK